MEIDKRVQVIALVLAGILLFAAGVKYAGWRGEVQLQKFPANSTADPVSVTGEKDETEMIWVDIGGAVNAPGVYRLKPNARVFEAVEKAGGLTAEANTTVLNQAAPVADGRKIYIPWIGDETDSGDLPGSGDTDKVCLNTASAEELAAKLPGIGPVLAGQIVKYRNSHGNFQSIEEIQNVSGIGPARFEQIKDYLTL